MRDNFFKRSYVDNRGKKIGETPFVIVVHCERFLTRNFRASAVWMENEKEIKKIRNKKYVYIYTNSHAHTRIPVYTSKMWKPFSDVINLLKAPPPLPILLSTRSSMYIVEWLYEKSKVKVSLQLRQLFGRWIKRGCALCQRQKVCDFCGVCAWYTESQWLK